MSKPSGAPREKMPGSKPIPCVCGSENATLYHYPCFDGPVFCVKCAACGRQGKWQDTKGQAIRSFGKGEK